jgi:6,7-dimethyl-8-ribityllumazine synthase
MELERSEEGESPVKEPMNEKDSVLELIAAPTVAGQFHYAVIVSEFNSFITDQLLRGALRTLESHQVGLSNINVVHVPGAYEIPFAAKLLSKSSNFDAIICLGCLVRGDTFHYELIANEVSRGIGQSALETGVPHSFGVITCDTQEQAINRAGLKAGNKGSETALAAILMAIVSNKHKTDRGSSRKS